MTTDYTRTERENIGLAWSHLIEFAETTRMGDSIQLEDAAKEERRNVSSPTVARALLLRTLVEVCDPDHRTGSMPSELWTYRRAHRDMIAYAWHHREALIAAGLHRQARIAADSHEKATRRALDALNP